MLRIGAYRFFFYSSDGGEPIHVHVEKENNLAKIWVDPVRLQNSGGFNRPEIRIILSIVQDHQIEIMEAWNDYFSG
ncbi:conserved hypothetical protein [Desulfamplus magnetovallimortis]|uniref:DUF4160 domain-containing protein n=1 Tax=Desulfamplus magnetovallimortis TaxID=1246637 RepID=A0A1W1H5T0_9BACT|nr:DUF4160 domain-containing protein [Desulfamplus magnetovallimortis]SLM27841.1 conserved hypothetical protein [Desulfamplus magnetovallimortis]